MSLPFQRMLEASENRHLFLVHAIPLSEFRVILHPILQTILQTILHTILLAISHEILHSILCNIKLLPLLSIPLHPLIQSMSSSNLFPPRIDYDSIAKGHPFLWAQVIQSSQAMGVQTQKSISQSINRFSLIQSASLSHCECESHLKFTLCNEIVHGISVDSIFHLLFNQPNLNFMKNIYENNGKLSESRRRGGEC